MSRSSFFLFSAFILAFALGLFYFLAPPEAGSSLYGPSPEQKSEAWKSDQSDKTTISKDERNVATLEEIGTFSAPMDRAGERISKKNFGMFITPETSPVEDDKFRGYHTGTDFEIFPEELTADVPVRAICLGNLVLKKTASGYGGVVVQECDLNDKSVTVVYGHMKLESVSKSAGKKMESGEIIGVLGDHKSSETNGARKHLHLSVHHGKEINIKGYISSEQELSGWADPCLLGSCKS